MRTLSLYFLLISLSANCQILPDSIIITKNSYEYNFMGNERIIKSDNYSYKKRNGKYICGKKKISNSIVLRLLKELNDPGNKVDLLKKFNIDTILIKNKPEELLKLYSNKYENPEWNDQQKEFIYKRLTNLNEYKKGLIRYLSEGGSYTMHNFNLHEYYITLYNNGLISNQIRSRKHEWGYQMPWVNQSNDTIYNINIELVLKKYTDNQKVLKPEKGDKLLKYLSNEIINNNMVGLYKLSAYSYLKEIEELKTDFNVISFEEVYGRGRYIWNEPKTMKITLKNDLMLSNVYLQFLAGKVGNTIYSRDSIKKNFKEIVNRVQSIPFIVDYLKHDTDAHLDIYYFNNSGINQYSIDRINKNPVEWKKQDTYIESLKWYEKSNIKPSFDIDEAIKTSEHNYCGCNYRFDYDFVKKAIFFEITSNKNSSSIWFLLPDNTVLLYHIEAYHSDEAKVLNMNLSKFGKKIQLPFACLLFDYNGNLINKHK